MKNPTYLYHPLHGKRLVSADDAEAMASDCWVDSPAKIEAEANVDKEPEGGSGEEPSGENGQNGDDAGGDDNEPEGEGEQSTVAYPLATKFHEDPESLEKPELLELGKKLGLKLLAAWKEDTLRNKITEALDADGDD